MRFIFLFDKIPKSLLTSDVIVLSKSEQTFRVAFDTYEKHTLEVVKRSEPEDGITSLIDI